MIAPRNARGFRADAFAGRNAAVRTSLDIAAILFLSLLAECAHFSWKQGRHVICADSVQYVDGAEALLGKHETAHFEFRKPGYSLILAGVYLLFGNMGWGAIALNHAFQALLPLAAYGLGRNLHSRLGGWLAAVLLIARLQAEYRSERIMSETVYATMLTFAVLVFAAGLRRLQQPPFRCAAWFFIAGGLLGFAWLIRSVAVAVIAAAVLCLLWALRRAPIRAVNAIVCLSLPIVAFVLFECTLNGGYADRFWPGTGTLGPALLIRMRSFVGAPFPQTDTAQKCLSFLPDREPEDAYLANKLDGWVAWHRAIHQGGMDAWQIDALMKRAALEMIRVQPGTYLGSMAGVFARYALRQNGSSSLERVPSDRRQLLMLPTDSVTNQDGQEPWYAHWALPKRTREHSAAIVERMRTEAQTRAPFGEGAFWQTLRYWSMTPIVSDVFGLLRQLGSLWPGFALLGCGLLGLNRKTCSFLALAYFFDACIVAATAFSDSDITRFQFIWVGIDTTLAAVLVFTLFQGVMLRAATFSRADVRAA